MCTLVNTLQSHMEVHMFMTWLSSSRDMFRSDVYNRWHAWCLTEIRIIVTHQYSQKGSFIIVNSLTCCNVLLGSSLSLSLPASFWHTNTYSFTLFCVRAFSVCLSNTPFWACARVCANVYSLSPGAPTHWRSLTFVSALYVSLTHPIECSSTCTYVLSLSWRSFPLPLAR